MSRFKLWAGLTVLFGAGALTGVVGTCLYHDAERAHRGERGPAAQYERILKRLASELSLTGQQQADIEPIVRRTHVAILELRFAHQSEVEQILTSAKTELKGKLSPEQRARLDAIYARLEQRWQRSRDYLNESKKRLAWLPLIE
jgi:hypothetical protein